MRKKQVEIDAELVMRYLETSGSKSCSFKELDQALGCLSHEGRIRMDEQAEQISLAVCPFF